MDNEGSDSDVANIRLLNMILRLSSTTTAASSVPLDIANKQHQLCFHSNQLCFHSQPKAQTC